MQAVVALSEEISLADLLDAIEANGFEQSFGELITGEIVYNPDTGYDRETVKSACALGQAMVNLGLYQISAESEDLVNVIKAIMYKNDKEHKSLKLIADEVREEYFIHLESKFKGGRSNTVAPYHGAIARP